MSNLLRAGIAQQVKNAFNPPAPPATNTLKDGLVACWNMDETSGLTMNDVHAATYNGTISGDITVGTTSFVSTPMNKCYSFAGLDPKVTVTSVAALRPAAWSVGIWVKLRSLASTPVGYNTILRGAGGNGSTSGWRLVFDPAVSGSVRLTSGNGSAENTAISKTGIGAEFETKMFLVGTYDGTNLRFYYNSVLVGTLALTVAYHATDAQWFHMLWGESGGAADYVGDQDFTVFYNRAITQTEIDLLYNSGNGTIYADFGEAAPIETLPPTVSTNSSVVSVTDTTATSGGDVTSDGNATVTAKGVCWATTSNPTLANSFTNDGSGVGGFTSNITGLTPNTTYYLRAYATNSVGTAYGNQVMFVTEETIIQNTLINNLVSIWEFNDASGGATDSHGGNHGVVSGGVVRQQPSVANLSTSYEFVLPDPKVTINSNAGLRAAQFSFSIWAKFSAATGTNVHSIVTGAGGNGYQAGWRISHDAYSGGRIVVEVSDNATTATRKYAILSGLGTLGLYDTWMKILVTYSGSELRLVINNVLRDSQTGVTIGYYAGGDADLFHLRIGESGGQIDYTGFIDQPAYYSRVITMDEDAILYNNGAGKPYSEFGSTTPTVTVPNVSTSNAHTITDTTAIAGGVVLSDGGAPVTARGIVWGLTQNPTLANNFTVDGSGTGTFTSNMTNLNPNTTYWHRAYATNSQGTSYGVNMTWTTAQASGGETGEPTVTGTKYYISDAGIDTNSGLSSALPWKTITRANQQTLNAGDGLLFRRGDLFEGNLVLNRSGDSANRMVIGAYGTGNKPKICGSRALTGWSLHSGGNVFRKAYATAPSQLFLNGVKMRLARYENTGYSFITTAISSTQFSSNQIDGNVNHVGATIYVRSGYYQSAVRTITAQSNQTLTLSSSVVAADGAGLAVDKGFVLMNKVEYLTAPGEWVYSGGYVYFRTLNGDSPDNYNVRISVDNYGLTLNERDYVNVLGVEFQHQKLQGIVANRGSYQLIEGNNFIYNEEAGYRNVGATSGLAYHTNNTLRNNYFKGQNGLGVYIYDCINVLVEENEFRDIGVFNEIGNLGHGEKDTWGSGFEISRPGNYTSDPFMTFRYNNFYNICYNGFFWRGKATIWRNYFEDMSVNKQDGGAIYTNTQGDQSHVYENITVRCIGEKYGYSNKRAFSTGIYIDEICPYTLVEYNTVIDSGEAGIKMHKNNTSIVRHNQILDARYGILNLGSGTAGTEKRNLNNNTIVIGIRQDRDAYLPNNLLIGRMAANLLVNGVWTSVLGRMDSDNNKLVFPWTGYDMFRDSAFSPTTESYRTLAEWRAAGWDVNSTLNQAALGTGESYKCFFNKSKVSKNYQVTGTNVKNVDQAAVSTFTLAPYRSIILRGSNMVVSEV